MSHAIHGTGHNVLVTLPVVIYFATSFFLSFYPLLLFLLVVIFSIYPSSPPPWQVTPRSRFGEDQQKAIISIELHPLATGSTTMAMKVLMVLLHLPLDTKEDNPVKDFHSISPLNTQHLIQLSQHPNLKRSNVHFFSQFFLWACLLAILLSTFHRQKAVAFFPFDFLSPLFHSTE